MSYITYSLKHFLAINAWLSTHGGQATLDLPTFHLEIKARHRYYTLFPQFVANVDGKLAYVPHLTPDVFGFIGWLPYRALRWPLSSDKLLFKRLAQRVGLRVPALGTVGEISFDHVVKRSAGSFGTDVSGPFRRGTLPRDQERHAAAGEKSDAAGEVFVEEFIKGRNLKVWFWGAQAFHAHLHDYPLVTGDGSSTVEQLAADRLKSVHIAIETYKERQSIMQALLYQGLEAGDILPPGETCWLDFRYGRRFCAFEANERADNALPRVNAPIRTQIDKLGSAMGAELGRLFRAPVLFAADGVVDDRDAVWWLEVNSNPILVPSGYAHVLGTLFDAPSDIDPEAVAGAEAQVVA